MPFSLSSKQLGLGPELGLERGLVSWLGTHRIESSTSEPWAELVSAIVASASPVPLPVSTWQRPWQRAWQGYVIGHQPLGENARCASRVSEPTGIVVNDVTP